MPATVGGRGSKTLTAQGLPAGSLIPFRPNVQARWATRTPWTSTMCGVWRSGWVRLVPVWPMPWASKVFSVRTRPSKPASRAWLDAVEQVS